MASAEHGEVSDRAGGTESSSETSKLSSKSAKERCNRRRKRKDEGKVPQSESQESIKKARCRFSMEPDVLNYDTKSSSAHQVQYHLVLDVSVVSSVLSCNVVSL